MSNPFRDHSRLINFVQPVTGHLLYYVDHAGKSRIDGVRHGEPLAPNPTSLDYRTPKPGVRSALKQLDERVYRGTLGVEVN